MCLVDLVEETLDLCCIIFDMIAKFIFLKRNAMYGMFKLSTRLDIS